MKKAVKIMAVMLVAVMSLALLVSCGVSEKTADKINKAVQDKKSMTYEEVKKLCGGDPTIKLGTTGENASGLLVWANGCKTLEDVQKKAENDKDLKVLYVSFLLGKAVSASYEKYDANKKS